ncbi:Copine-9 [Aix galericulata]|nr:Copine-9 [Aix galericulata]
MCPGLGWLLRHRVGGCGAGQRQVGDIEGLEGGGCEQEPPGLTPSARGAGLPGAGVRGAGGGDRVPAGPPGESPHVSRTPRWGWGSHTVPPATRPTWGPPHGHAAHGGRRQHHGVTQSTPRPAHPVLSVPTLASCRRGVPGKRCGTILLLAEELSNCRVSAGTFGARGEEPARGDSPRPQDIVTMQLCANKLDKKDFFGKSDPFLVFYRSNEDGTFTICHKTEVVKNTLNPVWQPFTIPVRALCNGDYDRAAGRARGAALRALARRAPGATGRATVKIDVYDWDRDGSHDFIGEFATSYRELSRAQSQFTVYEVRGVWPGGRFQGCWEPHSGTCPCPQVLNPRKKCKKKKYVNSGTVTLLSFSVESEFTFVDYIRGGTQLNFTVAIDFTASNGMPSQPTSLHYASPYQLSAYALALKAVGEIIQDYDSDKLFPAYGFGAKLPPDGKISHQFPLPWEGAGSCAPTPSARPVPQNNNEDNPSCNGIEGVLESYLQSLRTVQLYGPTNFAPVINQVAGTAAQVTDGSQYHVLLIITDGVISDMLQTKEAIVTVSAPRGHATGPRRCPCPSSSWEWGRLNSTVSGARGTGGVPEQGTGPGDAGTARRGGAERRCPQPWRSWTVTRCGCPRGDATPRGTSCSSLLRARPVARGGRGAGPSPWGRAGGPFPGRARRLLPQFVPFRDYVDDSGNQVLSMARLAKDVLAEIPEQLLSYMKTRDIKPRRADPQ